MKLLQNLKSFQRLPIFLQSKFVSAKVHFDFYFRNIIKAAQERRLDVGFDEKKQDNRKVLYDFSKPHFFYNWIIINDKEIGGESEGNVYFNNDHLYMKGELVEERNDLLMQRMYYGIASKFFTRLNLADYNGIRLTIKTDGNLYKVLLSLSSNIDIYHQIYAFVVDNSKEWQTLELPFNLFLRDQQDVSEKPRFISQEDLQKFILKGVAIIAENEKALDFEVSLKSIEVVYKEEFENLSKKYQRPFFIHAQDQYQNSKELNTGKEKLNFEEDKFEERKKSVNDLFSEEEIAKQREYKPKRSVNFNVKEERKDEDKPAMTIKERLAKKLNNK